MPKALGPGLLCFENVYWIRNGKISPPIVNSIIGQVDGMAEGRGRGGLRDILHLAARARMLYVSAQEERDACRSST